MIKTIRDQKEYKCLSKIISEEIEKGFPKKKITFKVKNKVHDSNEISIESSHNSSENLKENADSKELQNSFLTVKVKKLNYTGKPAIAVYINNVSKDLNGRVAHLKRLEEK